MGTSTLSFVAIAALAIALPATPSLAGTGPYWNCSWATFSGASSPAHFPRWTKAEARQHALQACRRAGGGRHCKIQCWRESGDPSDPSCRHCMVSRPARWRPPRQP